MPEAHLWQQGRRAVRVVGEERPCCLTVMISVRMAHIPTTAVSPESITEQSVAGHQES
jgi:hypothetical protein